MSELDDAFRQVREDLKDPAGAFDREQARLREGARKGSGHELGQLVEEVRAWAALTFPDQKPLGIARHLENEIGELLTALEDPTPTNVREELADVALLVLDLAGFLEIDLEAAIREKFAVIRSRTWGEENEAGFHEHDRGASP